MKKRFLLFLFLAAILAATACTGRQPATVSPPQDPPAATSPATLLPLDPAIVIGRLDNGLAYYIRQNREPRNRAILRLVIKAGSILEEDDQQGLAHFVEHMAFKGSDNFPRNTMVEYLESLGMAFGPGINAATGFDSTTYYLNIPADTPAALENALLILEDWAGGVTFADDAVAMERGVVLEEWRLGQGAETRMLDQYLPVVLHQSHYAERLPIGRLEVLQNFKPERLRDFYKKWYRPDLMAVIAVGDFTPATVEKGIKAHFSRLRLPAATAEPNALFPVPDHDQTLFTIVTDPEATDTDITVYYKHSPRPEGTVADYRQSIIQGMYDAMFNFRLAELSQQAEAPFLDASSGYGRLTRSKDTYTMAATVEESGISLGLATLLQETERVKRHGFTLPELARQRLELLAGIRQLHQERDKIPSAALADEYSRNYLTGEPVPGIDYEYELTARLVPSITLAEVNRLARELTPERNRVVVVTMPAKAEQPPPTASELEAIFTTVASRDIPPYTDKALDLPLVEPLPTTATITAETAMPELGLTYWELSNGVRVILKPTDFQNDSIQFTAFSPGGYSLVPETDHVAAITADTVIPLGGLGDFSMIELAKKLAGKSVSVSPAIDELTEGISGSSTRRDLETMFQLIYQQMVAPRPDPTAFATQRNRMRAALRNREADPEAIFSDAIKTTLSKNHFRRRPMSTALLEEMDLERSMAVFRDRFADASDFTFIFVGSFSPAELRPLVLQYLGGLPDRDRVEQWRDLEINPPRGIVKQEVVQGLEPRSLASIIFTGPFSWSQENRHALQSLADLLNIRLRDRLREELGGVYSINVQASSSKFPRQQHTVSIIFGAAPDRLDELLGEIFSEISRLQQSPPEIAEIATIKEIQKRQLESSLRSNSYWLRVLQFYLFNREDLAQINTYETLIDALKPAAVQMAAQQYLDTDNYVQVVLLPEPETDK